MRLYVGNLPYNIDENELREIFGAHGTVTDVKTITDRETGRSRGFGFVEFADRDEANKAIEAINGQEVGGRTLVVNEARERQDRGGGGGGGGGWGGGRGGGGGGRQRGGW